MAYWVSTLAGAKSEFGSNIAVDANGGTYVIGYTNSEGSGGYDVLVVRYQPDGSVDWQKVLGGALGERGQRVAVDSLNHLVYVVGYSTSQLAGPLTGISDILLAQFDITGAVLWQKAIGGIKGDFGYGIAVSGPNVYIVGTTESRGAGSIDAVIGKFDSSGNSLWRKTLGDTGINYGYNVAADNAGNAYLCGTNFNGGVKSLILAKYLPTGALDWQTSLDTEMSGTSIALDATFTKIYVCGETTSAVAGENASLIATFDTITGTTLWQRTFSNSLLTGIAISSADEIYLTGVTDNKVNFGGNDLLIINCDPLGDTIWQKSLGDAGSEFGGGIVTDNAGSIYVNGATAAQYSIYADLLTVRLPDDGSPNGIPSPKLGKFTYAPTVLTNTLESFTNAPSTLTSSDALTPDFPDRFITLTDKTSNLIGITAAFTTTTSTTTTSTTTTTTTTSTTTTTTPAPTTTTTTTTTPPPGPTTTTTTTRPPKTTTTTTPPPTTTTTTLAPTTTTTTPPPSGPFIITNIGARTLVVRSVIFKDPPGIGHTANLTQIDGSSTETGDAALNYSIPSHDARSFAVSYYDTGAGVGTYTGTVTVIAENSAVHSIVSTIIIV
jgi:hypothetical protein